jgi:hypothetical protein
MVTSSNNTHLLLRSKLRSEFLKRKLTLRTLDSSLKACTLLSAVAIWWITAIDRTASILESRKGRAKLSQNITSCSFSRAIWARAWHLSEPILKMTGLMPRYFPLPQPKKAIQSMLMRSTSPLRCFSWLLDYVIYLNLRFFFLLLKAEQLTQW